MKRTRKVKFAAFNIVTHPHSTKKYRSLFILAHELRQVIKIWGDTHALLGSAYQMQEEAGEPVTGEVFTFLEIDPSLEWFDIVKGKEASDEQAKELKIPENLRPHFKRIRYVFFPDHHMIVFVTNDGANNSLSTNRMNMFLERLLNDNRILQNADVQEVEVRPVFDHHDLEWMFEHLRVEHLEITIRRPNGDTGGDAEQSVEEELEDQNIREYFIEQKAEKGKSLKPNKRTKRYLKEAETNGVVKATGLDEEDRKKEVNTSDTPRVEAFDFDPRKPFLEFVVEAARVFVKLIRSRKEK